ncbi:hypothetical protein V7128_09500 [Neobacillus vireti]
MLFGAEGGEDSCLEYGAGETPQALMRRGGSPARPRKAKPTGAEINNQD